jgi:uncharacterized protein (DUF2252 family)
MLIDVKKSMPSCILSSWEIVQPSWKSEAERIKEIQKRVQFTTPALLNDVELGDESYIIKELQLPQDKMDVMSQIVRISDFELFVQSMSQVTAWSQLRSGGRQGSAIADDLIAFGSEKKWKTEALEYSLHYFGQVEKDYQEYCSAFDDGVFK